MHNHADSRHRLNVEQQTGWRGFSESLSNMFLHHCCQDKNQIGRLYYSDVWSFPFMPEEARPWKLQQTQPTINNSNWSADGHWFSLGKPRVGVKIKMIKIHTLHSMKMNSSRNHICTTCRRFLTNWTFPQILIRGGRWFRKWDAQ